MNRKQALLLIALAGLAAAAYWKREEIVVAVTGKWKQVTNAAKYLPMLAATEKRYGIPPDLLARIAYQESHFRDDIVSGQKISSAGATGIMQLVPKWHPTVNPLDVPAAIDYAGNYLRQLYAQFKSWPLAVAAYNAGPGNVQKYKGIPPFTETQNYVSQVFGDLLKNASDSVRRLYA
jgi:soluble lytic murein transglycosylase-like protein